MVISNRNIIIYFIGLLVLIMLGLVIFYDFPEKIADFCWYDHVVYWFVNTVRIAVVTLAFVLLGVFLSQCENEEIKFRVLIPLPFTKAREEWKLQREINQIVGELAIPKRDDESNQEYFIRRSKQVDILSMLRKQLSELNG